MGLDTVELVMAFEEAFDLAIPNAQAERLQQVRDVVDYVVRHRPTTPSTSCSTQQVFHQVRRGLRAAVPGCPRPRPSTRLRELVDGDAWPGVWQRVHAAAPASGWPARVPHKSRWRDGPETVGELVLYLVASAPLAKEPRTEPWTRDEIVRTVRQVIREETGLWKVRLDDGFVADLGLD